MKKIEINRLLLLAAAALGVAIVVVTFAALLLGKRPGMNMRRADPFGVEEIKGGRDNLKAFKEFGTLRTITMPQENSKENEIGTVIVITPWFSYESNDSAFYEELVSRKRLFTALFLEYFSSRTKAALLSIGEKKIKEQLLQQFNSQLIMGQLTALYFDDYMFLD